MGLLDYISDDNNLRKIISDPIIIICLLLCVTMCVYKYAVCQDNINKKKVTNSSNHHKICNNRNDMINLHNYSDNL